MDPDKEKKKAEKYCLKLLSIRSRSESELKDRLSRKKYTNGCIDSVMESLKKKGLINDLRYCRDWIEYRLHEKPRSLSFIKKELEEKGIDSRVMEESFGRFLPGVDDIDIAEGILRKKGSGLGEDVSDREKASLYRALLNRGFEPDLAEEALERFLNRDIS